MAHKYEVSTNDGTYNVTTNDHHDDHGEHKFKNVLLNIIVTTATSVASGLIVHKFTYKGRA
jgi:hypothetical protein